MEIYTIGHSNHDIEDFLDIVESHQIETIADVRHYPGSRRLPHFNRESLRDSLIGIGVRYEHILALGGRRKVRKDSRNTSWKNESFRGYADYMESDGFRDGIKKLLSIASGGKTAYMCAEAVWWQCHRSMISDHLKSFGFKVIHIMGRKSVQEHKYTAPARIEDGILTYVPETEQKMMF